MDKHFDAFASVSVPPTPSPGSTGWPRETAPGVPGTVIGAHALYMLFAELLNVITTAGITPDKAAVNQLTLAIQKLVKGAADSYPTGGVLVADAIRFSNGTILQEGSGTCDSSGTSIISFPHAFPNACQRVVGVAANGFASVDSASYTTTRFIATHDGGGSGLFHYMAWGN